MSSTPAFITTWARSAVVPHGAAFRTLPPHALGAPVLQAVLQRAGLPAHAVDAVVLGNALGAGGNPARMVALAAGLSERCAALSVDTQCCAGLDAIALAAGLLASGQAEVVVAGGVEAWSRAPIRQHRPLHAGDSAVAYERPAFAPDPARDPDLLQAAADYAAQHGITRPMQDQYALHSHTRAVQQQALVAAEIVPISEVAHDTYPRLLRPSSLARMPIAAQTQDSNLAHCAVSTLAISTRADGAAMVLMMSPAACQRWGVQAPVQWLSSASIGVDSAMPLLAAEAATRKALERAGMQSIHEVHAIELHDAFAVQGIAYCRALGIDPERINRLGGGLARGHPIGASGAIALVRVLADLARHATPGAHGLAAVAGAGGVGAACVVQWREPSA
jgi:acetyl-CoA C-acetyltransferase